MKTDAELKQAVLAVLSQEPSVKAAQIGVEANDGIVTVVGHLDTDTEKSSVERTVQRVSGVKALALDLGVRHSGASQRNDEDIARSVQSALQWHTYVTKDAVKIAVQGGQVTLSGELEWEWQRQGAVDTVRDLTDVVEVRDQIVIKPK